MERLEEPTSGSISPIVLHVHDAGTRSDMCNRKIKSAVTGEEYEDQHLEFPAASGGLADWFKGLPAKVLRADCLWDGKAMSGTDVADVDARR
eukprot:927203-Rhodomonas_salina.2